MTPLGKQESLREWKSHMTVDAALARIMELRTLPDAEARTEIRKILSSVHYSSWSEGWNEGFYNAQD
jgi:hypothetical protein